MLNKLPIRQFIAAFTIFSASISVAEVSTVTFEPYSINYKAKIEGFNVKANRSLKKLENNQYKLIQEAKASMMKLTESSTFQLHDGKPIETLNYSYVRKVIGFNKKYRIDFSDQAKTATYKEKKETKTLNDNGRTLFSLLSYQSEIRRRLLAGETNLSLPIISKGRIRAYTFDIAGQEKLKTKLGLIDCIKIVRKRTRKQKETTIWLAKNWQYNIVKIEHKEEGSVKYRLDVDSGSIAGKKIQAD